MGVQEPGQSELPSEEPPASQALNAVKATLL